MGHRWQLQEAKSKFSAVIAAAVQEGPQLITRHGTETAVILSVADYRALLLDQQRLSEFFRESPLAGLELDLARDRSPLRTGPPL